MGTATPITMSVVQAMPTELGERARNVLLNGLHDRLPLEDYGFPPPPDEPGAREQLDAIAWPRCVEECSVTSFPWDPRAFPRAFRPGPQWCP